MSTKRMTASEIVKEREKDYGNPWDCHRAIGQTWGAILRQTGWTPPGGPIFDERLPSSVVALMMAALKIVRLSHNSTRDSFLDAHVYLDFAEEFTLGRPDS